MNEVREGVLKVMKNNLSEEDKKRINCYEAVIFYYYDRHLDFLGENIRYLYLPSNFNQPVDFLPVLLKKLVLKNENYSYKLFNLPFLEELVVYKELKQDEIDKFPVTLKILKYRNVKKELKRLRFPNFLEELELPDYYDYDLGDVKVERLSLCKWSREVPLSVKKLEIRGLKSYFFMGDFVKEYLFKGSYGDKVKVIIS